MLAIWVTYFICIMGPSPSESVLHFHTLAAQAVCLRVDDRSQLDSESSPSPRCRDPFHCSHLYKMQDVASLQSSNQSSWARPTNFISFLHSTRQKIAIQVLCKYQCARETGSKRRKRRQASALVAYHKPSVRIIRWLKT